MSNIIFALMHQFGLCYGEARDILVGACMGDVEATNALAAVGAVIEE